MDALIIIVVTFTGYLVAYHTYGKFLARKIFNIDPNRVTPSHELEDGIDYVPTKKQIIFGHHYTSIAGTGPIVGPAIGVIWGWIPALVWIFLGSIVMGAVHDFGSLVISIRNKGKSISETTAKYIHPRIRRVFYLVVCFELWIVIAIFGVVIAVIFSLYPASVFPVWIQIPIAMLLGWYIYGKKGNIFFSTLIAVIFLYGSVYLGSLMTWKMPTVFGMPATGVWTIILLIYAYIASTLPVIVLLQPRDYINAWQLYVAMILLVLGAVFSSFTGGLHLVAPALQLHPAGAPPLVPFLFITIACGAISGFHSLVASGTSSKQISNEKDALFVGYGSMLMEAVLATLVLVCVAAGIGLAFKSPDHTQMTGTNAWNHLYSSWSAASGLKAKLDAFIQGAANMMVGIGIPWRLGVVIMGLFVASFAGTTLDTATRIQRYLISELGADMKIKPLENRWTATAVAVITAAVLAFATGAGGKGAMLLWPMFGAVNQLLAALALGIITLYLQRKGGLKWLLSGIPFVFMTVMTLWVMVVNEIHFIQAKYWLLIFANIIVMLLAAIVVIESVNAFKRNMQNTES